MIKWFLRRSPKREVCNNEDLAREDFVTNLARDLLDSFREARDSSQRWLLRAKCLAVVMFPRGQRVGGFMSRYHLYRDLLERCWHFLDEGAYYVARDLKPVIESELKTSQFWYRSGADGVK